MGIDSYLVRVEAEAAADFVSDPGDRILEELVDEWGPPRVVDMERNLDGLHFLLTGTSHKAPGPLGMAFGIREGFNPDDEFPIQYLAPNEVKQIATALAAITKEKLLANFDRDEIKNAKFLYNDILLDETDDIPNAWRLFEWSRTLYEDAAKAGEAVFILQS
jgi:hypothetical protein